jgi:hypothetical protein
MRWAHALGLAMTISCAPAGPANQWVAPIWPDSVEIDLGEPAEVCAPVADEGPWDSENKGALTGYFAVEAIIKAKVIIATIETRQYLLLRLEQDGTRVRQKVTVCELRLPSFEGLVELKIPPPAQALIQSKAQVVEGEFLSADEVGATYSTGPQLVLVGAELAGDPMTSALPTDESPACPAEGESCTTDEDCDGFPGITMAADVLLCDDGVEQLYIALRTIVDLDGEVGPGFNSLEGTVSPALEWSVLGYSNDCLEVAKAINLEIIDDTPFKAIRVDGRNGFEINIDDDGDGEIRCSDLSAALKNELADWVTPMGGD